MMTTPKIRNKASPKTTATFYVPMPVIILSINFAPLRLDGFHHMTYLGRICAIAVRLYLLAVGAGRFDRWLDIIYRLLDGLEIDNENYTIKR